MASQHSVQQLLALDDDALVQFMTNIRDGQGIFDISNITNWGHTARTDQSKLQERLAALGPLAKANRLLDFSKLVEKLREIPHTREPLSGESSIVPSSPQAERLASLSPQPELAKEHQIRCYRWLVEDGGKPLCSLEALDKIYESPEAHVELLQPWLGGAHVSSLRDLGLFSRQLECWKDFRRWQRVNRGLSIVREEDFASFLDEQRRGMESKGFSQVTAQPEFETTIRNMWPQERDSRERQWRHRKEAPNGTFLEYTEAAQLRVARHGFTQQFELREDAEEQDGRVTWIEYLEFECWTLDQLTVSAQTKDGTKGPSELERSRKRKSSQQLRVQWVLREMPADPEAAQPAAAAQGKRIKTARATRKRKREDENESTKKNTDAATDEMVNRPTKKPKIPQQHAETTGRKGTSRMLVELTTLVDEKRVKETEEGTRRSARIQKTLEAKKMPKPKRRKRLRASTR